MFYCFLQTGLAKGLIFCTVDCGVMVQKASLGEHRLEKSLANSLAEGQKQSQVFCRPKL